MRNKKLIVGGAIVLLALFALLIFKPNFNSDRPRQLDKKGNSTRSNVFEKEGVLWFINGEDTLKQLDIEFAKSRYEITRGLMDRRIMAENQGMLFIFPSMQPRSFWMKNTPLSLDIIYITDNLEVESIQKNTQPYSEASLPSDGEAQYVLEVNAGLCDQYGIGKGTRIAYKTNSSAPDA